MKKIPDNESFGSNAKCANCKEIFDLDNRHISYEEILFCSEDCLAEYTIDNDLNPEFVENDYRVIYENPE